MPPPTTQRRRQAPVKEEQTTPMPLLLEQLDDGDDACSVLTEDRTRLENLKEICTSAHLSARVVYKTTSQTGTLDLPFCQKTWFLVLLFPMGLSFFALAVFLYINLGVEDGSPFPASAASTDGVEITYGSAIKLMHEKTKFRLHSHEVPYGSGIGQQSVTGFPNVDDSNSYRVRHSVSLIYHF